MIALPIIVYAEEPYVYYTLLQMLFVPELASNM
jgi:hypothetical protein